MCAWALCFLSERLRGSQGNIPISLRICVNWLGCYLFAISDGHGLKWKWYTMPSVSSRPRDLEPCLFEEPVLTLAARITRTFFLPGLEILKESFALPLCHSQNMPSKAKQSTGGLSKIIRFHDSILSRMLNYPYLGPWTFAQKNTLKSGLSPGI